jgi:indolepyruvate ferredoxin oxidoreductase alpha subunit
MVKMALNKITNTESPQIDKKRSDFKKKQKKLFSPRSSTLCAGCSHLGSYAALRQALRKFKGVHILDCDIGCYEQAGYGIFAHEIDVNDQNSKQYKYTSLYEFIDTCYEMGSSLTMAQGQAKVGYKEGKIVAIMGDSTFYHAALPGIVNAVYNDSDITLLILQNYWTAMTGHQPDPGSGLNSKGEPTEAIAIDKIVRGMGTKFLRVVDAYNIEEAAAAIEEAIRHPGFAVVEIEGECRLQYVRKVGKKAIREAEVCKDMCNGCKKCVQIGCPAVGFDQSTKKAYIDTEMCTGCGICKQVCSTGAITIGGEKKQ